MLSDALKILYGTSFTYFVKSFGFHHNIEGGDFGQLHAFFGEIYGDTYGSLDQMAEYIRTLEEYAPGSFERFAELSILPGQTKIPRARLMLEELLSNTETLIELLKKCFESAVSENRQDIANFIADRISQHGKFAWQMKSFLKDARA